MSRGEVKGGNVERVANTSDKKRDPNKKGNLPILVPFW